MKLYPDKLRQHFQRGIAPIYLLYGDEPLGINETSDVIRSHLKEQGYSEREVIVAAEDADWQRLRVAADSMSLFAEKRIVELKMPLGKTGRSGADALKEYAQRPAEDIVLLLISGKLERAQTQSAWFRAIDKIGVTMVFYPLRHAELPAWIEKRMRAKGLTPSRESIELIAERVEGNMLAAHQEVERLSLLYPEQSIDTREVLAAVANSARYSISDCVDAAMQGATQRALRVLSGLQGEAAVPTLVLWSLTQEIRAGTRVAQSLAVGMSPDASLKAANVWRNRIPLMRLALNRHTEASWLSLLRKCSWADKVVKGHADGDPWTVLADICVELSREGQPVVRESTVI